MAEPLCDSIVNVVDLVAVIKQVSIEVLVKPVLNRYTLHGEMSCECIRELVDSLLGMMPT